VNHTCGVPNATVLENSLIATKDIQPGDELFLNYHAGNLLMDRDSRRYRLRLTKYFHCNCVRCTTGVDWTGGLPCPRCNPRTGGLLDNPNGATAYRNFSQEGSPWVCNHCGGSFDSWAFGSLVLPLKLQNMGVTLGEHDKVYELLKAVELLACWSHHPFLTSNYEASKIEPFMLDGEFAERVLGRHHWGPHVLAAIHALHKPTFEGLRDAALKGAAWAKESPVDSPYQATQDSHFNDMLLRLLQHPIVQKRGDPALLKLESDLLRNNLSLPGF